MSDTNHVFQIGRLTRDAEAPNERGPVRISIAVNRSKKQGDAYVDEPSFFEVEYWHRSIMPYLVKGKQVAISGELRQERWEKDGQPRSKIVIVVNDRDGIQLLGGGAGSPAATAGAQAQKPDADPAKFDDDIPF